MSEELKTLEIGIDCAPGDIRPSAYIGIVAAIFGLTEISIWQAFGLTLLCNFLFGGNINTYNK